MRSADSSIGKVNDTFSQVVLALVSVRIWDSGNPSWSRA